MVLFLDECDTICPPRDPARPHESRVTSQLLGLLDSLGHPHGTHACNLMTGDLAWQRCPEAHVAGEIHAGVMHTSSPLLSALCMGAGHSTHQQHANMTWADQ